MPLESVPFPLFVSCVQIGSIGTKGQQNRRYTSNTNYTVDHCCFKTCNRLNILLGTFTVDVFTVYVLVIKSSMPFLFLLMLFRVSFGH